MFAIDTIEPLLYGRAELLLDTIDELTPLNGYENPAGARVIRIRHPIHQMALFQLVDYIRHERSLDIEHAG